MVEGGEVAGFFLWLKEAAFPACAGDTDDVFGGELKGFGDCFEFVADVAVEHRGVVGVEGDEAAGVDELFDGVCFDVGEDTEEDVANGADGEGDLGVGQVADEGGVFDRANAVVDTFDVA